MTAPKKPIEPVGPPTQRIVQKMILYPLNSKSLKMLAIPRLLGKAKEAALKNKSYPNIKIEGEWQLDQIQMHYYSTSTLIWTGGEISWDNPSYDGALKNYERALKQYPLQLKKYEEDLEKYNYWKANKKEIAATKKREKLEKQLAVIQEKLKVL